MSLYREPIDPVEASFDSRDLIKITFESDPESDGVTKIVAHYRVPEKHGDGGVGTRVQTVRGSDDLLATIREDPDADRILGAIVADTTERLS